MGRIKIEFRKEMGMRRMEKLNANVVALSLGFTTAVLYILCLGIVAVTPIPFLASFVNALQHSIDVSGLISRNFSFIGAMIGIVGWFVIAAATGYIFSLLYNFFIQKLTS